MIGQYELLYITAGAATEEEAQQAAAKINELTRQLGATVVRQDTWGKRKLTYEIKHQRQGLYTLLDIDIDTAKLPEFDHALRLNETVLRFQLVRRIVKTPEQLAAEKERRDRIAAKRQAAKEKETVAAMTAAAEEPPAPPTEPKQVVSDQELNKKLEKILEEDQIDV